MEKPVDPALIRRLRKLLQVTRDQVSDEQLLHDTKGTLTRALIEADLAMMQFVEVAKVEPITGLEEFKLWLWRLSLFYHLDNLDLTPSIKGAWRWSRDLAWEEYYRKGMSPLQAISEELRSDVDDGEEL